MTNTTPLSRPQLMARLAGERGHLLWSLNGMSEALLTESTLHNNWKLKDIFPHIGRWDETFAGWIALMQAGRGAEIQLLDDDVVNQTWHETHHDYNLEQGVAVFLKGRGGLWAALERLTDEEIEQPVTLATGRVTMVKRWIAAAYRHDAQHAEEILAWRKANPFERVPGPLYLVRALVRATRKEFLSVAANVPDAEKSRRPVCGVWTLQDVVGHIADWEAYGVEGIEKVLAGEGVLISPCVVGLSEYTIAIVNEEDVVQPNPFGQGTTERVARGSIEVKQDNTELQQVGGSGATVSDLLANLKTLGLTPEKLVAVFQALDQGGFLHAQLEVR